MRKRLIALAVAVAAILGILIVGAPPAGAYYPVGTLVTIGNTPAPGGSISCWQSVPNTSASILRCYKYDYPGNVTGTYEATLPTPYCNRVQWVRQGSASLPPILEIADGFFGDYPGYPNPNMYGGAPGCLQGNPQTGSQGWRSIWVHPNGVTELVGTLEGGSWINGMTAQRSRDCVPNDSGMDGYSYPFSPCIRTLIEMQ